MSKDMTLEEAKAKANEALDLLLKLAVNDGRK